jgi:hypothetical protein
LVGFETIPLPGIVVRVGPANRVCLWVFRPEGNCGPVFFADVPYAEEGMPAHWTWPHLARQPVESPYKLWVKYDPGGEPGENVYTCWVDVMRALSKVDGPKRVDLPPFVAIPPGTWEMTDVVVHWTPPPAAAPEPPSVQHARRQGYDFAKDRIRELEGEKSRLEFERDSFREGLNRVRAAVGTKTWEEAVSDVERFWTSPSNHERQR